MARRTILVVDDEPQIRSLVRNLLSREDYAVIEAENGEQALKLCRKHGQALSLVVTDVIMPSMDGIELAERLAVSHPALPVLYMSGRCDMEAVQKHIDEHGFGFLRKPFTIDALCRKVREMIDSGAQKKPPSADPQVPKKRNRRSA